MTMRTNQQPKLCGLEYLRFFAAFAVLAHHILEEMSASPLAHVPAAIQRVGACGVDVFFVISGLVMWHTTAGFSSQTSAKRFLTRRLTRIIPPYWMFLAVVIALSCSGIAYKHRPLAAVGLVESAFLLPPTTSAGLVLGVAWTLVYEVYFYLICTAALFLPWQKYRLAFIGALIAGVPIVLSTVGATAQGEYYGNPIVVEFLAGIFLGAVGMRLPESSSRIRWMVSMACVALFYWASLVSPDKATAGLPTTFRWWAWGIPAVLLVAAFMRMEDRHGRLGRTLALLGNASYVLYLTHGFWMNVFAKAIKSGMFHHQFSLWLAVASIAGLAVASAVIVHLYVEKPLLGWFADKRSARILQSVRT
ncbi:acyltransferase [Burkholderia sp. Ax-1719]|uniref:acyltransferase family protein n=1 Tax=Burkholderia sp. Ax-1719 TaxID=2608334 RepID=UPI001F04FD67|nr:acyltransferase [Burkholderia sp. Ax-1719]